MAVWDPSSSLGFGGTAPDVRTVSPGNRVFCRASDRDAPPLSTVLNPTVPTRSRYLCSVGRRRSPSISTTLCSASARASAMLIAVVDLPSLGTELVSTMIRGGSSTARNCRFVRSFRKASAMAELSLSNEIAACLRRSLSSGMLPTRPVPVISSTVSRFFTVLSSMSRKIASPTPNRTPRASPTARLRRVFGTTGDSGMDARCSTTTRESGAEPSSGVSSSRTRVTNSSDRVLAISRAVTGDSSRTCTVMRTVSSFALALTFSCSSPAVISRSSLSMVLWASV